MRLEASVRRYQAYACKRRVNISARLPISPCLLQYVRQIERAIHFFPEMSWHLFLKFIFFLDFSLAFLFKLSQELYGVECEVRTTKYVLQDIHIYLIHSALLLHLLRDVELPMVALPRGPQAGGEVGEPPPPPRPSLHPRTPPEVVETPDRNGSRRSTKRSGALRAIAALPGNEQKRCGRRKVKSGTVNIKTSHKHVKKGWAGKGGVGGGGSGGSERVIA